MSTQASVPHSQLVLEVLIERECERRRIMSACAEDVASWEAGPLFWLTKHTRTEDTHWLAKGTNFAGGDFVTGPGMVVEAIAAGRRGAIAIDKYLRKDASRVEIYDRKLVTAGVRPPELDETWEEKPRTKVTTLPLPERSASFTEIEIGFSEDIARREAKRCLRCDLEG